MQLGSVEELRAVYRPPGRLPVDKVVHRLDHHCADFLARSPFFVLSTAGADGACDASPRGGPPGFVRVLDERHLAWPDLSGNNRLDSFQNLVGNDRVALLFLIPGLDETLRVNGTAALVTDEELCASLAVDEATPPGVAVVVTVTEAYVHCARALRRAALWSPEDWLPRDELPSAARILKDHAALDDDVDAIADDRERRLQRTLWAPGGAADRR